MTVVLTALSLVVVFAIIVMFVRHLEKRNFNNGICTNCNSKFRRFDTDSQGGRGYICDKCGNTVWVSYKVDKSFEM